MRLPQPLPSPTARTTPTDVRRQRAQRERHRPATARAKDVGNVARVIGGGWERGAERWKGRLAAGPILDLVGSHRFAGSRLFNPHPRPFSQVWEKGVGRLGWGLLSAGLEFAALASALAIVHLRFGGSMTSILDNFSGSGSIGKTRHIPEPTSNGDSMAKEFDIRRSSCRIAGYGLFFRPFRHSRIRETQLARGIDRGSQRCRYGRSHCNPEVV